MSITLEKIAQSHAFSNYGDLVLVDAPEYDKKENLYVSRLRSDYPLFIQDDLLPDKKTMRVLKIGKIGTISINSEKQIVKEKTSSRDEIISNLHQFFKLWRERAERIVIEASAQNLVKISESSHFFDPIISIIFYLWDEHKISDEEILLQRSPNRRKKIKLYLKLLEGLKIVRRIENGYCEGNTFLSLRKEVNNDEECFKNVVLSHIIQERYTTLRDVFQLTILEPTIHIDNSIYLPELETEQTVYRNMNSIRRDYEYYYGRSINPLDLKMILKRLVNANAINQKGKYYSGNQKLLNAMVNIKKSNPDLSPEFLVQI
ncbi:MAG: hypothetical protein QCH99_10510 [Candidatus Bathyarchaeota archaeon]|nr:hypothetical protein [Candidatus Bathyarchaeum tardum]WGM88912.1 MAG: hypothetical protein NUK63_08315 [Candidatus Bathyarchaeum tardum]